MAICFDKSNCIGHITVRRDGISEPIVVDIYGGNCLAVFVYTHDGVDELFWFYASEQHGKNILKDYKTAFPFEVLKCVVDYSHPSAHKLVKLLTKSMITVLCI